MRDSIVSILFFFAVSLLVLAAGCSTAPSSRPGTVLVIGLINTGVTTNQFDTQVSNSTMNTNATVGTEKGAAAETNPNVDLMP